MDDYYDRIIYIRNSEYSLSKIGRVIDMNDERRKKIVDALEDGSVQKVYRCKKYHNVRVLYKDGHKE